MSAKTLICLKGNFEALPVIRRAHALGLRLVVVDKAPDPAAAALADQVLTVDAYDAGAVTHLFETEFGGLHFDGVLCCCGDMPHTAAALAQMFGLPGLTPAQAHLSVDKLAQKTALRLAGLPVPDFRLADDLASVLNMGLPLVIKPADSRGARGVTLVTYEPFDEYDDFPPGDPPARVAAAHFEAESNSPSGRVYAEKYLPGPQLSTESIIQDGRVLFTAIGLRNYDRLAEFAPHIIEDGYDMPWGDSYLRAKVDVLLEQACKALNWNNLTVKGDWIIHDGKLVILELAARLSGGFFGTHGIPLAHGYPFVDVAIELALGGGQALVNMSSVPPRHDQFVCQRYVFPAPEDIGRRMKYFNSNPELSTKDHPWVAFATLAAHPGDIIAPVVSHGQRWGQATCTGVTPEQARERAERAVIAMKAAVVLE